MTEWEKMLAGKLYSAQDEELLEKRRQKKRIIQRLRETGEEESAERERLFRALLGSAGKNLTIRPPFYCDYGCNISVGDNFYANYDCVILDVCPVVIGSNVMFGPRVSLFAATHPIDPGVRASGLELGRPITIGDDVWIGGCTVVNPGVTIGNGVIIGAGSVVTRDIPDYVIAAGNPCRVVRPVTEEDRAKWEALAAQYDQEQEVQG